MRTTINLSDDAVIVARNMASKNRLSLGEAISELIRRGAGVGLSGAHVVGELPLRGRFALLPARDELITPQHVRDLMDQEGV